VAGPNIKSGKPVQFEGFVCNASLEEEEDARLKNLSKGRGRSDGVASLRIQGRGSYGGQRLIVDALTASLTPAASKTKMEKK
jgi:hypothetical protein